MWHRICYDDDDGKYGEREKKDALFKYVDVNLIHN